MYWSLLILLGFIVGVGISLVVWAILHYTLKNIYDHFDERGDDE